MQHEVDPEFAAYVRARQHRLLQAAYLVCGDVHLAEELVQAALARLAQRWERLRGDDPDEYVRRTLYRDAVSPRHRDRREDLGLVLPQPESPDPVAGRGERIDLERALLALTPRQRAVIVLRWFEDRSDADTAEVLGVSLATVRNQSRAAITRLRGVLPGLAPSLPGGEEP
jgi:RNA polymerase sigma-70 factor (sigma-E family)